MFYINGEIHTMSGGIIRNGYLSVQDGKIAAVGEMADWEKRAGREPAVDRSFQDYCSSGTFVGFCSQQEAFTRLIGGN